MLGHLRLFIALGAFLFGAHRRNLLGGAQTHHQPPFQHGPPPSAAQGQGQGASNMAIAALVCGIGAWFVLPLVAAIAAIVIGKMEVGKIDRGESSHAGRTFAQIGMWLGVAQIVLAIVGGCVSMAVLFFFFGGLAGLAALTA